MKNMLRVVSLFLTIALIMSLCACSKPTGDMSSVNTEVLVEETVTNQIGESSNETVDTPTSSDDITVSTNQTPSDTSSENNLSNVTSNVSSDTSSEEKVNPNASAAPEVTLCARVASNIYIIGGICSANTEYISVGGAGVTSTKITPAKGEKDSYFIGQVSIEYDTLVEIQGKENGKDLSKKVKRAASINFSQRNLMLESDYKPVFGSDSRMHFYSALLSYSLSDVVDNNMRNYAEYIIGDTVDAAKRVGAEVIYLVVPSSAAVYPETVPSEYKAASGETIYEAFNSIATSCGAKVIYPLDTMKTHKNDGVGYKIYSHTDSHWTTYGAYWGVYELMNYISGTNSEFASAKPRTVADMGFYVTELYGGDALFSFDSTPGFEDKNLADYNNGLTSNTKYKELTTLYNRVMPTDTLSKITRNKKSIYLNKANEAATTFTNPNGNGLPSAVIVRDSFGRTPYDMINDRFSMVTWLAENDYTGVISATFTNSPDYVIYVVSERNLLKVMLNNADVRLLNYR